MNFLASLGFYKNRFCFSVFTDYYVDLASLRRALAQNMTTQLHANIVSLEMRYVWNIKRSFEVLSPNDMFRDI